MKVRHRESEELLLSDVRPGTVFRFARAADTASLYMLCEFATPPSREQSEDPLHGMSSVRSVRDQLLATNVLPVVRVQNFRVDFFWSEEKVIYVGEAEELVLSPPHANT